MTNKCTFKPIIECSDFTKRRKFSHGESTSSSNTSETTSPLHAPEDVNPYTAALTRQRQTPRPPCDGYYCCMYVCVM